jgi:hypothetical protein
VRRQTFAILLITTLTVATKPFLAEKGVFVPANDVSLSILTPQKQYKAGEMVVLSYRITNISNAPLYVPRAWEAKCPSRQHFSVWFENEAGEHLFTGYIAGNCIPAEGPKTVINRMTKEAVLLRPSEYLEGKYPINTATFDFLKPGTYRFEALLSCWQQEEFTPQDQGELAEMKWPFVRGDVPASIKIVLTSK